RAGAGAVLWVCLTQPDQAAWAAPYPPRFGPRAARAAPHVLARLRLRADSTGARRRCGWPLWAACAKLAGARQSIIEQRSGASRAVRSQAELGNEVARCLIPAVRKRDAETSPGTTWQRLASSVLRRPSRVPRVNGWHSWHPWHSCVPIGPPPGPAPSF